MKEKVLVVILVVTVGLAGAVGCGGGGGGGGSVGNTTGTVLAAALFTLLIVGTGGAAAPVAFAASIQENRPGSLRPAVSLAANNIFVKVTPFKNGSAYGTPVIAKTSVLAVDAGGNLKCDLSLEAVARQYLVEIIASSTALGGQKTLLKKQVYSSQEIKNGAKIPATVDSSSTAFSMVYDSWLAKAGAPEKDFGTFENRILTKTEVVASLAVKVQRAYESKAALMSGSPGAPTTGGTGTANPTSGGSPDPATPTDSSLEALATEIAGSI